MSQNTYRIVVLEGMSGTVDDDEGLNIEYLEDDRVTPVPVTGDLVFKAEFPQRNCPDICIRITTAITYDAGTGAILVPFETTTFSEAPLKVRGTYALTEETATTRRPILTGQIIKMEQTYGDC